MKVTQYIIDTVKEEVEKLRPAAIAKEPFISGGVLLREELNMPGGDIDVFVPVVTFKDMFLDIAEDLGYSIYMEGMSNRVYKFCDKVFDNGLNIVLVLVSPVYETPEDIVREFDLNIVKMYQYLIDETVYKTWQASLGLETKVGLFDIKNQLSKDRLVKYMQTYRMFNFKIK